MTLSALLLLQDPLRELPYTLTRMLQAFVSVKRVQAVLDLPELKELPKGVTTSLSNCCFGYEDIEVLSEISLDIVPGEFIAIIGTVGSGKTSLLNALLGEMDHLKGELQVTSSLSYAPSIDSWLLNATLRQNVLMGSPFAESWYWKVLSACGMLTDLEQLPGGDLTEIGEKGVNLSGGQKARICLARAVYSQQETILLDDPFSCVDPGVAQHIYTNCLCRLLKDKTILLVTHREDYAAYADRVLVMSEGRIKQVTYPSSELLGESSVEEAAGLEGAEGHGIIEEEEREQGRVNSKVYIQYFQDAGYVFVVLAVLVMILWNATLIAGDIYLKE